MRACVRACVRVCVRACVCVFVCMRVCVFVWTVFRFTSCCLCFCCLISFWSRRESSKIKHYFTHLKRSGVLWCQEKRRRCSSCMDRSYASPLLTAVGGHLKNKAAVTTSSGPINDAAPPWIKKKKTAARGHSAHHLHGAASVVLYNELTCLNWACGDQWELMARLVPLSRFLRSSFCL